MKSLFLFTNHYPYSYQENFLEDEINYLAERFDRVHIIPFEKDRSRVRPVPNNCLIHDEIHFAESRSLYILKGLFSRKGVCLGVKEFFRSRVYTSRTRFRAWALSVLYFNNMLNNRGIQSILHSINKEDVVYFFWGIGQNLLATVLKGKAHLVSRFHGEWDLWEKAYGDFHSLRTDVAKSLDVAVFIAKSGEDFFKKKYPFCRTAVFPLGTKDHGVCLPKPDDDVIRVVSCSTVYPLKRVPLIFDSLLALTGHKIEWTHIGAGSHFEELKQMIDNKEHDNISIILTGMKTHDEVMEYYKNHHYDVFVNLSTSEGVPVSIMEAMSFDIPIVATNVGSTSEEVVKESGELLSANPTVEEVADAILKVVKSSDYKPRSFWKEHYNAEVNYRMFADMLASL